MATLPLNKDVLAEAIPIASIEHFLHLLRHAKSLVGRHGPYTKQHNITDFSRDVRSPQHSKSQNPSLKILALSLAAAQDYTYSVQPDGPTKDDLDVFTLSWVSAVTVLEEILVRGSLPQESFSWGIFGLSAGYMHPTALNPMNQNIFSSNKHRLQAALCILHSLNGEKSSEYQRKMWENRLHKITGWAV